MLDLFLFLFFHALSQISQPLTVRREGQFDPAYPMARLDPSLQVRPLSMNVPTRASYDAAYESTVDLQTRNLTVRPQNALNLLLHCRSAGEGPAGTIGDSKGILVGRVRISVTHRVIEVFSIDHRTQQRPSHDGYLDISSQIWLVFRKQRRFECFSTGYAYSTIWLFSSER